jgi:hypothetical protein
MVSVKELWKVAIISSTTSALVLLGGYLVLAQTGTWSEPTATPPGNNALAPLNAGPAGQSKSGGLILNTGGAPNGLIVNSGATSLGGQLNMNNNKVTNLLTATNDPDAVNFGQLKSYVAAQGVGSGGGLPTMSSRIGASTTLVSSVSSCRNHVGPCSVKLDGTCDATNYSDWRLPTFEELAMFLPYIPLSGGATWTRSFSWAGGGGGHVLMTQSGIPIQYNGLADDVVCVR